MLSAEPDEEVAELLSITNLCQTLHCLPGPGGLFDQHPYLIEGMKLILMAQNEKAEMESNR